MTIKERRKQILEDTINHYNSTNRAATEKGRCYYYDHKTGRRCAIGRLLAEEEAIALQGIGLGGCQVRAISYYLPESVFELGIHFLSMLQSLHDKATYWNEEGLSESGKEFVEDIKTYHISNNN